ncbi:hypothetical protein [Streptomyces sp. NPDC060194]|uniref:hypothetical protein n=1 Tax=Streptomyces sp. NPDC060194 TaxID=3347069 RepID=UPI00366A1015
MNRVRRAVVSRRGLGAGAVACAALLLAAPSAQAVPLTGSTVAVGAVTASAADTVAVRVDYTCPALGLTDTLRVTVTDTVGGGQYRALTTAVCDGTPHTFTARAARLAGPTTRAGHDVLVTAAIGASVGTFFLSTVSDSATRTLA